MGMNICLLAKSSQAWDRVPQHSGSAASIQEIRTSGRLLKGNLETPQRTHFDLLPKCDTPRRDVGTVWGETVNGDKRVYDLEIHWRHLKGKHRNTFFLTLNPSTLMAFSHLCHIMAKKRVARSMHVRVVVIWSGIRCAVLSLGLMRNITALSMKTSGHGMQRNDVMTRGDFHASSNIHPKLGSCRNLHIRMELPCASAVVKPPKLIRVRHICTMAESRMGEQSERTAEYQASDVNKLRSSSRSKVTMVSRASPQIQCPRSSLSK